MNQRYIPGLPRCSGSAAVTPAPQHLSFIRIWIYFFLSVFSFFNSGSALVWFYGEAALRRATFQRNGFQSRQILNLEWASVRPSVRPFVRSPAPSPSIILSWSENGYRADDPLVICYTQIRRQPGGPSHSKIPSALSSALSKRTDPRDLPTGITFRVADFRFYVLQ